MYRESYLEIFQIFKRAFLRFLFSFRFAVFDNSNTEAEIDLKKIEHCSQYV